MKAMFLRVGICASLILGAGLSKADFLYAPGSGFIVPTLDFENSNTRYSEWRSFYSKSTIGNLPDYYAEFGGVKVGEFWQPTARPLDDPNFPAQPDYYQVDRPNAFWNINNPTITQTNTANGYITSGGNFYGMDGDQSFRLDDNTSATDNPSGRPGYEAGTVVFQFQTDGQFVDPSTIRLVYMDNGVEKSILATDLNFAEMLREYQSPEGASSNPSAAEGYGSRFAIQWNLTGLGVSEYSIIWDTLSHTSFQQASLDTSDTYTAGIPTTRAWTGGDGIWDDGANWLNRAGGNVYGSVPVENGNVRFENSQSATVSLAASKTIGELVFASVNDVVIDALPGTVLTSNTGITTTNAATGTYRINSDYAFGALNLFAINAGTVRIDGAVSGDYGFVKLGAGALVLGENNTFSGAIDIHAGTVRLEGTNASSAVASVRGGSLVLAVDNALTQAGEVKLGFDSEFFDTPVSASLYLDGAHSLGRDIEVVANNSQVIIGARNTGGAEATYSGEVKLSAGPADVRFRTDSVSDNVKFTGAITGGSTSRTLTIDGPGKVIFSGTAKNYNDATVVNSGTLVLETTIGAANGTGFGHLTVKNGAVFQITSTGRINGFAGDIFTPASLLTVENGGKLTGSGFVNRKVVTEGVTSVIEAVQENGTLTLKSLDANGGAKFQFEVSETPLSSPLIAINESFKGSLLEGGLKIEFSNPSLLQVGEIYTLFSFGSLEGLSISDFAFLNTGLELDQSFGTGGWLIDEVGKTIQVQFSAVPEPSTYFLIALALAGLVFRYRFVRKS